MNRCLQLVAAVYGGTVARALRRFTDRKAPCLGVSAAVAGS